MVELKAITHAEQIIFNLFFHGVLQYGLDKASLAAMLRSPQIWIPYATGDNRVYFVNGSTQGTIVHPNMSIIIFSCVQRPHGRCLHHLPQLVMECRYRLQVTIIILLFMSQLGLTHNLV